MKDQSHWSAVVIATLVGGVLVNSWKGILSREYQIMRIPMGKISELEEVSLY